LLVNKKILAKKVPLLQDLARAPRAAASPSCKECHKSSFAREINLSEMEKPTGKTEDSCRLDV
jgi:hypothetical protein